MLPLSCPTLDRRIGFILGVESGNDRELIELITVDRQLIQSFFDFEHHKHDAGSSMPEQ